MKEATAFRKIRASCGRTGRLSATALKAGRVEIFATKDEAVVAEIN